MNAENVKYDNLFQKADEDEYGKSKKHKK